MYSKRIKDSFFDIKKENAIISKIKDIVYYPIESFFIRYRERIGRAIAFAVFSWANYDYDFAYTYSLMAFKLKRLHKGLINGCAEQHEEDIGALLEAIQICDRLNDKDYDSKYTEIHNKRWGKLEIKKDEVASRDKDGKPLSYYFTTSRKLVNDVNKEQERKEFMECFDNGEKDRCTDIDRLATILKQHSLHWWD